eukprot:scaffold112177_cov62-Phaeocystis_antarctica.AAC.2
MPAMPSSRHWYRPKPCVSMHCCTSLSYASSLLLPPAAATMVHPTVVHPTVGSGAPRRERKKPRPDFPNQAHIIFSSPTGRSSRRVERCNPRNVSRTIFV